MEEPAIDEVSIASVKALENTISFQQIAKEQTTCSETFNHRQGLAPRHTKFKEVSFGEVSLLCEVTGKPRPVLPKALRHQAMKQFHCLDHCGPDELIRRTAENFYWAELKKVCKNLRLRAGTYPNNKILCFSIQQ